MRRASSGNCSPTSSVFARMCCAICSISDCIAASFGIVTSCFACGASTPRLMRGADSSLRTEWLPHTGHSTRFDSCWRSKSSAEANQPSKECSLSQLRLKTFIVDWCRGPESNRHACLRLRRILSPLCLPVSPPRRLSDLDSVSVEFASGARPPEARRADQPPEVHVRRTKCDAYTEGDVLGGGGRNRTGVHGFAVRCMATLPPRQRGLKPKGEARGSPRKTGAGEESRTLDLNLGKA